MLPYLTCVARSADVACDARPAGPLLRVKSDLRSRNHHIGLLLGLAASGYACLFRFIMGSVLLLAGVQRDRAFLRYSFEVSVRFVDSVALCLQVQVCG